MAFDQRGIEKGRAERLGQPVHREQPRQRKQRPQLATSSIVSAPPLLVSRRIGAEAAAGQSCSTSCTHSGGTAASVVTPVLCAGFHHVARGEVIERNDTGAGAPRAQQLVLPIIERQRQHAQHHIIRPQRR